jgi:DNA repair protein RadC
MPTARIANIATDGARVTVSYQPGISKIHLFNEEEITHCLNTIIDDEGYAQQNIYAIFTDLEGMMIGWRHMNRGTASHCLLDIKTIIAIAAQLNACGVYLGHTMPHASAIECSPLLSTNMRYVRHAFTVCDIVLHDYFLLTYSAAGSFMYKSHLHPADEDHYPTPAMHLNELGHVRGNCMVLG